MFKATVTEYTVKQRGGKSPDIQVTQTDYMPIPHNKLIKLITVQRKKRLKSKKVKPIDYGITESQFEDILNKASKPISKDVEE